MRKFNLNTILSITLLACFGLTGCDQATPNFYASNALGQGEDLTSLGSAPGCTIELGEDFGALPGQQIALFMKSPELAQSLELYAKFPNQIDFEKMEVPIEAVGKNEWKTLLHLPSSLEPDSLVNLQVKMTASDEVHCKDEVKIQILRQAQLGDQALYSWDVKMLAEHRNENNIPEISLLDIEATRLVYLERFTATEVEKIPFPWILQPQTSLTLGSRQIELTCDKIFPGPGRYCAVIEDTIHPDSDADGDFLFQINPEKEKLTIFVDTPTSVGAKNATQLQLTSLDPSVTEIVFKLSRGTVGEEPTVYDQILLERTIAIEDFEGSLVLWEDQNLIFDDGGALKVEVWFHQ